MGMRVQFLKNIPDEEDERGLEKERNDCLHIIIFPGNTCTTSFPLTNRYLSHSEELEAKGYIELVCLAVVYTLSQRFLVSRFLNGWC
jgi:fatty acid-binding protein DegV